MSQERYERWQQFLSAERLGASTLKRNDLGRTEFHRDYDKIIYSTAFRRMQDKTQVFPLSSTSYTRTRLTHSLEVSTVGRSLGTLAAEFLQTEGLLDRDGAAPAQIGTLVAAACLAHDMGNPPFGHAGEDAIQAWARRKLEKALPKADGDPFTQQLMSPAEVQDFLEFEGNAQGFRIVTRLLARKRRGGLGFTCAFLGAFTKYPCASLPESRPRDRSRVCEKKFGYFQDDKAQALEAFRKLGMPEPAPGVFARHPLALLTEAADDICYGIIDIEDAYRLKLLTFEFARDLLCPIAETSGYFRDNEKYDRQTRIERMRAAAIHGLTMQTIEIFKQDMARIETGERNKSLIVDLPSNKQYALLIQGAQRFAYHSERVAQIQCAGYQAIAGLLDLFYAGVMLREPDSYQRSGRFLLPLEHLNSHAVEVNSVEEALDKLTPYQRLLAVTDYVSSMSDGFVVDLYQKISGIKLPA